MSKPFNVLTAGLPQIALGLLLIAATFIIWLLTAYIWFWPGVVGFLLLLWGLAGGKKDEVDY